MMWTKWLLGQGSSFVTSLIPLHTVISKRLYTLVSWSRPELCYYALSSTLQAHKYSLFGSLPCLFLIILLPTVCHGKHTQSSL